MTNFAPNQAAIVPEGVFIIGTYDENGVHVHKSQHVNAPIIEEYPVTLECKVKTTMKQRVY